MIAGLRSRRRSRRASLGLEGARRGLVWRAGRRAKPPFWASVGGVEAEGLFTGTGRRGAEAEREAWYVPRWEWQRVDVLGKQRSRRCRRRTVPAILAEFGNLPRRRITYRCGYGGPEFGPYDRRGGGDWQNAALVPLLGPAEPSTSPNDTERLGARSSSNGSHFNQRYLACCHHGGHQQRQVSRVAVVPGPCTYNARVDR